MLLTIDFVAQRYGVLPSKLLEQGSSIDIRIAELAQTYRNKKEEEQIELAKSGQIATKPPPKLSEEKMMSMLEKVRQKQQ